MRPVLDSGFFVCSTPATQGVGGGNTKGPYRRAIIVDQERRCAIWRIDGTEAQNAAETRDLKADTRAPDRHATNAAP